MTFERKTIRQAWRYFSRTRQLLHDIIPRMTLSAARRFPSTLQRLHDDDIVGHRNEELRNIARQRFRYFLKGRDGRVLVAAFEIAHIGALDIGLKRKVVLRDSPHNPYSPEIQCHSLPCIHGGNTALIKPRVIELRMAILNEPKVASAASQGKTRAKAQEVYEVVPRK